MKLIRFGEFRKEKPGLLANDGSRRDCSSLFEDWNSSFFADGNFDMLKSVDSEKLPVIPQTVRWGSCVARPGKVVCVGLNYKGHAAETKAQIPKEPVLFLKAANTVIGPYDNVVIPKNSVKTDYEIEIAIIIKKECRYLNSEKEAGEYIGGYTISNDVSEREFQKERGGGQWTKGKCCDTFNPVGPFMATTDEITDVNNLWMKLSVNGQIRQNGNTADMIFNPFFLVYHISQFMTLEGGDIISTGTPAGVAMGMNPPVFLKKGEFMELEIQGLGKQKQLLV
ncbi:MAG TPA: ureidoglycolate lyase [Lentisphaeria bacterium]|nr:MAG: ureidoglycolate lyase [Lentisphaerae bacterium GWF2_38_69]HBM15607.1 ureidoglycolate lyase [Lentisphaeria bacterium]